MPETTRRSSLMNLGWEASTRKAISLQNIFHFIYFHFLLYKPLSCHRHLFEIETVIPKK